MVWPTKVNFGLGFYPFQLYRRRPAEVASDCKGCKIEVRWGLDVVEGCSGAWSNLRPQFIRVVDNVARDGFILFVTRADAEGGSRTGLLFPRIRSAESRIILSSLPQHKTPQDS